MEVLDLHILNTDTQTMAALQELEAVLNVRFTPEGLPVRLEQTDKNETGLRWTGEGAVIVYHERVQIFRALGLLTEACRDKVRENITETPWHTLLAPMIDCSRNQVQSVAAIKKLVRHLALMGHNGLMLYTEDTYEIPERPYFGYMRGRYTAAEIREIDQYCQMFGIELIPCIQVLAHLNSLLRWNTFKPMFDANDILLVDDEKTYELIEDMFRSVTSMFTSRTINIGMDEAFLLGRGNYLDRNGYEDRSTVMHKHLDRVMSLCRKYGLKPMMWSDMFFSTAADGSARHYYDTVTPLPENIYSTAPQDISLVFWDYYHKEVSNYDKLIGLHKNFNNEIIFAGGAWRWKGFAPSNEVSLVYSRAALESCRKNGIRKLLLTAWAECGECGLFSVLPVFQLYAEACYRGCTENGHLAKRLMTCAQANLEDFMALDLLNRSDKNPIAEDKEAGLTNPPNPCRYLLWQDVLQGLYEKHIEGNVEPEDYSKLVPIYREAARRNPQWHYLFDTAAALSEVLTVKSDVGIRLRHAYRDGDRVAMAEIADKTIPQIQTLVSSLRKAFYIQWTTESKIFGYDFVDMRFGGLLARLDTAALRIHQYLEGSLTSIPELEEEILYADCRDPSAEPTDTHVHFWSQCATVSVLTL